MKEIEKKILEEGKVIGNDILKVDSFLNHQIDVAALRLFAKEVKEHFGEDVDRILTIETSGIAIAYAVAEEYGDLPLVFAKKAKSKTVDENVYSTPVKSFTHGGVSDVTVSKKYLKPGEKVLIVDDFLAEGNAALGLIDICFQAGAKPVGVAIAIEKVFQGGHQRIEEKGIPVHAGASIKSFENGAPVFLV